jgi:enoyl ACP reductase
VGILEGKKILITGVLNTSSIAYAASEVAIAEGAEIVLSGFGRGLSITQRAAKKLGESVKVIELDVTDESHLKSLVDQLQPWKHLDGVLHSIGYAPPSCIGGDIFQANFLDVATAIEVSTFSLKSLTQALLPLLKEAPTGASVVGLDFDAQVAWPGYNWMGVAKAGLESLTRYLARDCGPMNIRVNLISAGPIRTIAAKSVESFSSFQDDWGQKAPLGWNPTDATGVGRSIVALLSDYMPQTTGEIIHVDGGFHALGA